MGDVKPSPATVKKTVEAEDKRNERHRRDLTRVRDEGFREGVTKGKTEILNWLQEQYTGPDAPDRDSVEGQAIITLAREAGKFLRS